MSGQLDYEINKELGECYLFMGDLDKAEEYYGKAVTSNGIHADPYLGLATIAVQRGDLDKAMGLYRKASTIEANDKSLAGMALIEMERGATAEAFTHFKGALAKNPENLVALFGLVRLGHAEERLEEVLPFLHDYLALDPLKHEVRYTMPAVWSALAAMPRPAPSWMPSSPRLTPATPRPRNWPRNSSVSPPSPDQIRFPLPRPRPVTKRPAAGKGCAPSGWPCQSGTSVAPRPEKARMPMELLPIKRAILSVTDKTGLPELARFLSAAGVELVSTGGTRKLLTEAGLTVTSVSDVTGFPEIMGGRVKTLHPAIHGGILADKDNPEHLATLASLGIATFDMVVVNLYALTRPSKKACPARDGRTDRYRRSDPAAGLGQKFHSILVVPDPAFYPRSWTPWPERHAGAPGPAPENRRRHLQKNQHLRRRHRHLFGERVSWGKRRLRRPGRGSPPSRTHPDRLGRPLAGPGGRPYFTRIHWAPPRGRVREGIISSRRGLGQRPDTLHPFTSQRTSPSQPKLRATRSDSRPVNTRPWNASAPDASRRLVATPWTRPGNWPP